MKKNLPELITPEENFVRGFRTPLPYLDKWFYFI